MKNFLTIFDKLMIAVTFVEANEEIPLMETDTSGKSNRTSKTLLGNNNNADALLNGPIGDNAPA